MANAIAPFPLPVSSSTPVLLPLVSSAPAAAPAVPPAARAVPISARYELGHVPDGALHAEVKALAGRHNVLTAELLAHLAEVEARGIYRERACSSLYTYCIYELRLSEDEAQRRTRAARTARTFPILFEMLAEGAIHLTGLLLLAPVLTPENHAGLLALARFRTKREIEHLVAEIAPRADVPSRIEPLGPRPGQRVNSWQALTAALRGQVRDLVSGVGAGQAPPSPFDDSGRARAVDARAAGGPTPSASGIDSIDDGRVVSESSAPARVHAPQSLGTSGSRAPGRYRIEFTASERYVTLLEEARNLLQHQVPDRDIAKVHELAMAAFVEQLRRRRQAAVRRARKATRSEGPAPARVEAAAETPAPERATAPTPANHRHVPAAVRREVWQRDGGQCTFLNSSGRRCCERAGLELHHERAFALGGAATVANLRLLCRAHNALLAERDFGRAFVESAKNKARSRGPAGRRRNV